MNKKIEQKDMLFMELNDVKGDKWVVNKRHIVSAGAPLGTTAITRVVLSTGAIIDTYMSIGTITNYLSEVEHKTEKEDKP